MYNQTILQNIIKQRPRKIEHRLPNNSSNKTIFNNAASLYEETLSETGYNVKLMYNPNKKENKAKKLKKEHNMDQSTI